MLAINGGSPVIKEPNKLHKPYPKIGKNEREYIKKVLDSGIIWGTWAKNTKELEKTWAEYTNTKYCLALSSGTAALHSALYGCGIMASDEILVPAYSFISTASSILMVNAIPIFVDVKDDGNIDPEKLISKITKKTKAIIITHLHGLPCDMDLILEVAKKYNLFVIEDCAQAHGAIYKNKQVGSIGDVAIFSLNATKVLAGGDGGLLTTNNLEIFNRISKMRVFGMEIIDGKVLYRDSNCLGYNYRISEFNSAFTLARLKSFEKETEIRINNAEYFINGVKCLKGIDTPDNYIKYEKKHIYQLLRFRINTDLLETDLDPSIVRFRILSALNNEGLRLFMWETMPLPMYSIFKNKNEDCGGLPWNLPNSRKEIDYSDIQDYNTAFKISNDSIFTTSHYPPNNKKLIDKYIKAFHKIWSEMDQVINLDLIPPTSSYVDPF